MATFKDIIILQDGVSASIEDILKRTQKVNSATESLQKRMTNLGNKMKDIGKSLSLRITVGRMQPNEYNTIFIPNL